MVALLAMKEENKQETNIRKRRKGGLGMVEAREI